MTIGRTEVDITEDDDNVYLADWVIPKGKATKENKFGIKRQVIVLEMFEIWQNENPKKKRYNKSVGADVEVKKEIVIEEMLSHAYLNYRNVLAFYCIDQALKNATKVGGHQNPKAGNQSKFFKGGYMQKMNADIPAFPYLEKVSMMVGTTRKKEKAVYSLTSIKIE